MCAVIAGTYRYPELGEKKALAIVGWIRAQSLLKDLLDESSLMPVVLEETPVELNPVLPTLVPLSRIALPRSMTGEDGINRCRAFGQISAKNDLEAIQAYLIKHNEREFPKTHRSYRKELERYLLWCIHDLPKAAFEHSGRRLRTVQSFPFQSRQFMDR